MGNPGDDLNQVPKNPAQRKARKILAPAMDSLG